MKRLRVQLLALLSLVWSALGNAQQVNTQGSNASKNALVIGIDQYADQWAGPVALRGQ
jgi:hypothetical protein